MFPARAPLCLIRSAFLVLVLLSPSTLDGQASLASVSGVVVDQDGRTAVEGAEVLLPGLNRRALTSALGEFRFDELRPGVLVLQVSHPGYGSRTDTLGLAPGERVEVRLTVSVRAIELEPINVVARRNSLGSGLTGQFPGMTRTEIEAVTPRSRNLADLIQATNIPGLRVSDRGLPGERGQYCVEHPRARTGRFGQDACLSMNVYIDGRFALDGAYALADLPPENIERFEILGPLDAASLYGDAGRWGVILVETRSGSGATNRSLPTYARDDAPLTFVLSVVGSSPADLYKGSAVFTYQNVLTNLRYVEKTSWRPGLRAGVRARPLSWFPELELAGFLASGSSRGTYFESVGAAFEEHEFHTAGVELAVRPRLTRGPRWDLSFLAGPVLAFESFDVVRSAEFQTAPGLGPRLAGHMVRSWTTVGALVGVDFEWMLNTRASLLVGGRWRGLTMGEPGADISLAQARAGLDLLQLPQAKNRAGRRTVEVGLSLRTGSAR